MFSRYRVMLLLFSLHFGGIGHGIAAEPQLAFPTAEGFGRFARGGRGGDVYHVTTLGDDGQGSLRHGVKTASGPRTIVFDLSGVIELKSPLIVDKSFLTIAGQSAPGDGICLKDQTFGIKQAQHIIVRYLRVRLGDKNKPAQSGPRLSEHERHRSRDLRPSDCQLGDRRQS